MKAPHLKTAFAVLAISLYGCGSSDYEVREPAPTLSVALSATTCAIGETLTGKLTVAQRGATEQNWSLAAIVQEGSVGITVDDREIPVSGEWMQLTGKNATIRLTPETAGEHIVILQAMSATGEISNECRLTLAAEVGTELAAAATCETTVLDPGIDAMLPIRLSLAKEGYAGRYKVVATLARGTGAIYHEGNIVTDVEVELEAETTLYFRPKALGEQIIEFTVTAGDEVAVARAYMNIAKEITVRCEVSDRFIVSGTGRYDTEGATTTLTLENAEGYNFEAAGWYDLARNLLSTGETCPVRLTLGGISEIVLELKKREVRLETSEYEQVVTDYFVPTNVIGKLERRQAVDYRLRLTADYKLSDDLVFVYDTYKYDLYQGQTIIDGKPSFFRGERHPSFESGKAASDWFWNCDRSFTIHLRRSDNPTLKFNYSAHTVESASTRYLIPENIDL